MSAHAISHKRIVRPLEACALTIAADEAGNILVQLRDAAGQVYSQATLPPDAAGDLVETAALAARSSRAVVALRVRH